MLFYLNQERICCWFPGVKITCMTDSIIQWTVMLVFCCSKSSALSTKLSLIISFVHTFNITVICSGDLCLNAIKICNNWNTTVHFLLGPSASVRILGSVWIVRSRLTYTHFRTHTLIISLFYQPTQSIPRSRSWPTSPCLMTITRTNTHKHCVCGSCCCETRLIETIFIQACAIWGRRGAFPGLGLWEVSQSNHCQRTKLIDTFLMISLI